jgi:hypothetical protein
VAFDEGSERNLGELAFAEGEALKELAVREVADGAQLEEGAQVTGRELLPYRHVPRPAFALGFWLP